MTTKEKGVATRYLLDPSRILWRNRKSRVGLIITVFFILLITVGPLLLPYPKVNPGRKNLLPSATHLLGTDSLGQDIMGELAYGGGFILELSFVAALISIGIGTTVGLAAAYIAGKTEAVLMTGTDIALTIPGIILIIVVSQFVKATDPITLGALLSVVSWAPFARIIRSQILVLRSQPFAEAAKLLGLSRFHIIFVELLPNVMPYIAVNFIFYVEVSLFASVGLYYLAVLPYNAVNWGTMMNQAVTQGAYLNLQGASSLISPLAAITAFTVGLILLSAGFEEIFNPRLRIH
jgi:peptide/nickel transport system permease protein